MRSREAEQTLKAVREQLAADAADLRLPESPEALPAVETELDHYRDTQVRLEQAAHELRLGAAGMAAQLARETEARDDLQQREQESGGGPRSKRKKPLPGLKCCATWSAPGSRSCSGSSPKPVSRSKPARSR